MSPVFIYKAWISARKIKISYWMLSLYLLWNNMWSLCDHNLKYNTSKHANCRRINDRQVKLNNIPACQAKRTCLLSSLSVSWLQMFHCCHWNDYHLTRILCNFYSWAMIWTLIFVFIFFWFVLCFSPLSF